MAPAADAGPVLLLVLDGMGFASFRQLCGSLAQAGWQEWLAPGREARPVALAAAPSITRVSRTSLFAGRLLAGAAADERREWALCAQVQAPFLRRGRREVEPQALIFDLEAFDVDACEVAESCVQFLGREVQLVGRQHGAFDVMTAFLEALGDTLRGAIHGRGQIGAGAYHRVFR